MNTSVKMSEAAKKILDRLQAKVVLASGRKPTQEDLLEAIVKFSAENEEALVMRVAGIRLPFSKKEAGAFLQIPRDLGVVTREEDIDQILYGQGSRP